MSTAQHIEVLKRERDRVLQKRNEAADFIRRLDKAFGSAGSAHRQAHIEIERHRAVKRLEWDDRRIGELGRAIGRLEAQSCPK
jgi:hypothetical protein